MQVQILSFPMPVIHEAWLNQERQAALIERERLLKYTFQDNEHWQMYNAARDRCDQIATIWSEFYQAQKKHRDDRI